MAAKKKTRKKKAEAKPKNPVGRPRLYKSPEQFTRKVEEYQQHCYNVKQPVTWTGLALYLGFSSRESIDEYLNYKGFSDCVKRAKAMVEWHYEMRLADNAPAGAIFALKNYGWTDKQELDHRSPDGSMSPQSVDSKLVSALAKKLTE